MELQPSSRDHERAGNPAGFEAKNSLACVKCFLNLAAIQHASDFSGMVVGGGVVGGGKWVAGGGRWEVGGGLLSWVGGVCRGEAVFGCWVWVGGFWWVGLVWGWGG